MTLSFDEYQQLAQQTDQQRPDDENGLVVALLGLVGEAGSLLTEYKKKLRDGDSYQGFAIQVEEELGDLLWYLATISTRSGLKLEQIAQKNLGKNRERWLPPDHRAPLFDEERALDEQLPRGFEYSYGQVDENGTTKVRLRDCRSGEFVGDALTDNAYDDDGYRFHDILHLAHMVVLGWSPVVRKLLKRKRKSNNAADHADDVEDGARAQITEELVALPLPMTMRPAIHI